MTNIRMNFPWTENFYFIILATTLLKNFNSYPPPQKKNKRGGGRQGLHREAPRPLYTPYIFQT